MVQPAASSTPVTKLSEQPPAHSSLSSRKCSLWKVACVVGAIAAIIFSVLSTSGLNTLSVGTPNTVEEPPYYPNITRAEELDAEIEQEYATNNTFVDLLVKAVGGKEKFENLKNNHKLSNDSITSSGLVVNPKAMIAPMMIGEWNHQPYIAFKYKNLSSGQVSVGSILRYKSITWISSNAPFHIGGPNDLPAFRVFSRLVQGLPCQGSQYGTVHSYRLTNENVTVL